MRIVVTGGAGFIGSCFVREVLGGAHPELAGAEVTVLDAFTYAGRIENLDTVAGDPRLTVERGDVRDPERVAAVLGDGADLVVHFAAETHVDRSITGAADFVTTNVVGTQVLLQAALDAGVGRFLHVSTDEVYGSVESGSWPETHPLEPNSPYSAAKAGSDLLARSYHRTHGLDVVITRCSNNYGPYQFPEKVIPLFVTRLLEGGTVPLYGDGLHVRDWLHVSDHCRGVVLAATGGRAGEVYNIGGGTELTNLELTHALLTAVGAGPDRIERVADRKGHDRRYAVDWSKIHDELGYAPRVPFDEGLAATVAWYREHRDRWT
ncbi:dTDP-glucose 4,6-dehydratase [Pseudonocardia sp. ICBG1293]|uniref:dTDP-glucose 4,6-dehydratase n=1 Tax=Pseudonocardia sp. ICBG1293 TaxID=2844382 RepID=UPI001CCD4ECB|nr:dTDP-glucose 4,6-dehydratase [Pseudonocardia sp. ICBG1293]